MRLCLWWWWLILLILLLNTGWQYGSLFWRIYPSIVVNEHEEHLVLVDHLIFAPKTTSKIWCHWFDGFILFTTIDVVRPSHLAEAVAPGVQNGCSTSSPWYPLSLKVGLCLGQRINKNQIRNQERRQEKKFECLKLISLFFSLWHSIHTRFLFVSDRVKHRLAVVPPHTAAGNLLIPNGVGLIALWLSAPDRYLRSTWSFEISMKWTEPPPVWPWLLIYHPI